MHVDGSRRGIASLDLSVVLGSDEEKSALVAVKSLDISHNELEELADFDVMESLVLVDASFNRIARVSNMPQQLAKLILPHNQLRSLRDLQSIPGVVELDVSFNLLESLEGCPSTLVALKATNNHIRTLEGIQRAQRLEHVDVSANELSRVEELGKLRPLVSIKTLSISGNPFAKNVAVSQLLDSHCPSLIRLNGSPFVTSAAGQANHTAASSTANIDSLSDVEPPAAELQPNYQRVPSSSNQEHSVGRLAPPPTKIGIDAPTAANRSRSSAAPQPKKAARAAGDSYAAVLQQQQREQQLGRDSAAEQNRVMEEQLRNAVASNRNLAVLLEEERKTTSFLRKTLKALERDLADSKRVVSDELGQVAHLKTSNAKLSDEVRELRGKLEKMHRDLKFARGRADAAGSAVVLQLEQRFAELDAESRELKRELEAARRAASKAAKARDTALADCQKLRRRVAELESEQLLSAAQNHPHSVPGTSAIREVSSHAPTDHITFSSGSSGSGDEEPDARSSRSAQRLASELRKWVTHEVDQLQEGLPHDSATSPGRVVSSPPLSATRGRAGASLSPSRVVFPSSNVGTLHDHASSAYLPPKSHTVPSVSYTGRSSSSMSPRSKWEAQEAVIAASKLNELRQKRHNA